MKHILISETKQISATDKKKLAKADVIVIEANNSETIRLIGIDENIDANSYLMAALAAISSDITSDYVAKKFVKELHRRLLDKEKILNDDRVGRDTERISGANSC